MLVLFLRAHVLVKHKALNLCGQCCEGKTGDTAPDAVADAGSCDSAAGHSPVASWQAIAIIGHGGDAAGGGQGQGERGPVEAELRARAGGASTHQYKAQRLKATHKYIDSMMDHVRGKAN